MIQDIFPHRFDNHFRTDASISENDFILYFNAEKVLLKASGDEYRLPRKKDLSGIAVDTKGIFLFTLDEVSCFMVLDEPLRDTGLFEFKEIGFFRTASQQEVAWACIVGYHLANWYMQNRYCGKCGTEMQHKADERAIICPDCNYIVYPKISPAIIVAIICRDKILLARNSNFPGAWFSLVAGYADVGETLEETVAREVKEEVGLEVTNIRYYKSQPWPPSGSMMIGFIAEADDSQPVITDGIEIAEAAWFSRENLPAHSLNISIAGEMIEKFERGEL